MAKKAKRVARRKRTTKVSPIPAGMRSVTPYLAISGAAGAIEFYKKAFGAKGMERTTLPDGKVLQARLKIGDSMVMMADESPGSQFRAPTNGGSTTVVLRIYSRDVDKLWQQAVAAGAKVAMPLDNRFWGERYGQLMNPFGHLSTLSMRIKMTPEEMEEKRKAAMAMFAQGEHPGYEPPPFWRIGKSTSPRGSRLIGPRVPTRLSLPP